MTPIDNEIKNFAGIARINLPDDWQELPTPSGRGRSWARGFSPRGINGVEIGLFYDGLILSDTACGGFRSTLSDGLGTIYDIDRVVSNNENKARELAEALGNAGQNQLTMAGTEWDIFFLQQLDVTRLARRHVLHTLGYFHDAGTVVNYFESYRIDGTPYDQQCRVYEIYYRTSTAELFAMFKKSFDDTLASIEFEP